MLNLKKYSLIVALLLSTNLIANEEESLEDLEDLEALFSVELESKATTGSRKGSRDILNSKTPLDVVSAEDLQRTGYKKLSKALELLIPGFNVPVSSISDGTDHVSFFTLRGLSSDQVLVLINGQRLHSSALVNVNGSVTRGSSGVDIDIVPISMIDHVEILRDGAAAQYGSDAIAGVINIILKEANQDSIISTTVGQTTAGDGRQADIEAFYSHTLTNDGFVNIALSSRDDEGTNRAGKDYGENPPRVNSHYGDAESKNQFVALSTNINREESTFYANVLYNHRKSSAGAYYRRSTDSGKIVPEHPIISGGYLPLIEPRITNGFMGFGVKSKTNYFNYDLSQSFGYNNYHFFVNNTINSSLGVNSPVNFDAGTLKFKQSVSAINLTKTLSELSLVDSINLAGGFIYKDEEYKIRQGQYESYAFEDQTMKMGSQGFAGFRPSNETDASRSNIAIYFDVDTQINETFSVDLATRYERYNSLIDTLNGKIAASAKVSDELNLRASVSNGFRAPSLHQSYYTATATILSSNGVVETGTYAVNSDIAKQYGAVMLEPEESTHFTIGAVYKPSENFFVTLDGFIVNVTDRIVQSKKYTHTDGSKVQYFANAADTDTYGVDFRSEYKHTFENDSKMKLKANYTYSKSTIEKASVNVDEVVKNALSEGQPTNNIQVNLDYKYLLYGVNLNLNRVGSYKSIIDDITHSFNAKILTDLQLRYEGDSFDIMVGGQNIFDTYHDQLAPTDHLTRGEGKTVSYSQYSPFGYNGAYYYFRVNYNY